MGGIKKPGTPGNQRPHSPLLPPSEQEKGTKASAVHTAVPGVVPGVVSGAVDWSLVAPHLRLSEREVEIVRGIMAEQTDGAIARNLGLSVHTVHTYLDRLRRKLGVKSRVGVVVKIFETAQAMKS